MYILPVPKEMKIENGDKRFYIEHKTSICFNKELNDIALFYGKRLQRVIKNATGLFLPILIDEDEKENSIYFTFDKTLESQEYTLSIKDNGIMAKGKDRKGILYAIETLSEVIEQDGCALPFLEIKDKPDFLNRGYYLDQSRGRVLTLDYFKTFIDKLSRYKINQFQLYIEHTYLFQDLSEMWRNDTPLTAEDILELDRYCKELNIELVPSLSSFGHLYTLLNTKTYNKYCEMDKILTPFSLWDRMNHHTVDVCNKEAMSFIKGLIKEYASLFSSNKFNLCADETFDLGKGRSKEKAEEVGVHRIYIDYVKELSEYLLSLGKTPMFWGDIIVGEPDLVKELPKEIICLNWGYSPEQSEEPSRKMAKTGVKQYMCPGVCGWNQWMNQIENSYKNITLMTSYAKKYNALGILNTDWGDFGHVNEPQYSIPCLIYGANFSWNTNNVEFNEINKAISKVEYKDRSEEIVSIMSDIAKNINFDWCQAVLYYEKKALGKENAPIGTIKEMNGQNNNLYLLNKKLLQKVIDIDSSKRDIIEYIDVTIDCIKIWNEVGEIIYKLENSKFISKDESFSLAKKIEEWFMKFKELWRRESREGDLSHVAHIVFWYCDLLRDIK